MPELVAAATPRFSELHLDADLVRAVTELGFDEPTPIQIGVIPLMLDHRDVIAQAQTGTGKTAAFSLPILQNLRRGSNGVQALILAPTRELALQVSKALQSYGSQRSVRVLAVYGGQPYGPQIQQIRRGVDVIVGTPGRLIDLITKQILDLGAIHTVVLDEADEMLSMGFVEDIETILKETPAERQTALFSATLPPEIRRLADRYLHNPESVTIQRPQMTVAAVEQRYYLVNEKDKLAALTRLFEMEDVTRGLIFVRTKAGAGQLAADLNSRGYPAEAIHGDLDQKAREQVLNGFRQDRSHVLVATDVAARGLDIDDISHVFNYDLPPDSEIYVHRVGRTARAGKAGIAISLVTPKEVWRLRRTEGFIKQAITLAQLPTVEAITAHREVQLRDRVLVWINRGRCAKEREMVQELMADGHDPIEIAAAALKLARGDEKQRPIEAIAVLESTRPSRPAPRERRESGEPTHRQMHSRAVTATSHESGMVRVSLSLGSTHGIRPNDVVGAIAFHADIPGKSIGAIHIRDQQTLVDVPEQYVAKVLAAGLKYQIRKQPFSVSRS